jgi:hypothetical protein
VPHFTLQIGPGGPVLNALVGVSQARRAALVAAGLEPPNPVPVRALVDTGASSTCVEPAILLSLQLTPIGQVPCFTLSTGGTPQATDQYDVSLFIPATAGQVPFNRPTLIVLSAQPNSLHQQGIQALIGRDVLEHCLLQYNGTAGFFTLAY